MLRKDGQPKKKSYKFCDKCNEEIGSFSFPKHYKICDGGIKKRELEERLSSRNIKRISEKDSQCLECNKIFKTVGINNHYSSAHEGKPAPRKGAIPWNKGLDKLTDSRIFQYSIKVSKNQTGIKRAPMSEEGRNKRSEALKKAHAENRAYKLGTRDRLLSKPSYPEVFFKSIIDSRFNDKNVELNYPVLRFYLDFAWVHKKKYIEIDGDQHYTEKHILSDKLRDSLLKEEGWECLRIRWSHMKKDYEKFITLAINFIDG